MLDVEQVLLAETFQALLEREREAEKTYGDLATRADDPSARRQIELILREKQRHIGLVERLLEIVE